MQRSNLSRFSFGHGLRLLAVAASLVVAGGVAQTVSAAPWGPGAMAHAGGMGYGGMGYGGMGGMGPLGGMHARQSERLFDSIGATADQRTQIRQIWDAARADMQAQREAGRALHEQARTLFAQPTVDAKAVEALRQQMLAQHDAMSKRGMQAMIDASAVLTPEQRQAVSERMAERRAAMERRRAERAATPKPRQ